MPQSTISRSRPSPLLSVLVLAAFGAATVDSTRHRCIHENERFQAVAYQDIQVVDSFGRLYDASNTTTATAVRKTKWGDDGKTVEEEQAEEVGRYAAASPSAAAASHPLRLRFDVSQLYNKSSFCTRFGDWRDDGLGGAVRCSDKDVLTSEKRSFIVHRLLPMVGSFVEKWLFIRETGDGGDAGHVVATALRVPPGICGPSIPISPSHSKYGVLDADLVVYVLSVPLSLEYSSSSSATTMAWSAQCAVEKGTGRPLVAKLSLIPAHLEMPLAALNTMAKGRTLWQWIAAFFTDSTDAKRSSDELLAAQLAELYETRWTDQQFRSLLHEVLHALGFTPQHLRPFTREVVMGGRRFALCRAPRVRTAVQQWMDCPLLPGAALEQSGGNGTAGAHWERLFFRDEVMAGALSSAPALSTLTLSFFSSLPFYVVDMSFAEPMSWGAKAGCSFAQGNCTPVDLFSLSPSGAFTAPPVPEGREIAVRLQYWCIPLSGADGAVPQCTADRRSIGFCNAVEPSRHRSTAAAETNGGAGQSLLMEGCPVVEPYANQHCDDDDSAVWPPEAGAEATSPVTLQRSANSRGFDSRCFRTTALQPVLPQKRNEAQVMTRTTMMAQYPVNHTANGTAAGRIRAPPLRHAHCLQRRCVNDGHALEVRVGVLWLACPIDGSAALLAIPPHSGFTGFVFCDPAVLLCSSSSALPRSAEEQHHRVALRPSQQSALPVGGLLPVYRIFVSFALLLKGKVCSTPAASSERARRCTALLRALAIESDKAFDVALEGSISRDMQRRGFPPLGAEQERRAGATRLVSTTIALLEGNCTTVRAATSADAAVANEVEGVWQMLVGAEVAVTAPNSSSAERILRPLFLPQPGAPAEMYFTDIGKWWMRLLTASAAAAENTNSAPASSLSPYMISAEAGEPTWPSNAPVKAELPRLQGRPSLVVMSDIPDGGSRRRNTIKWGESLAEVAYLAVQLDMLRSPSSHSSPHDRAVAAQWRSRRLEFLSAIRRDIAMLLGVSVSLVGVLAKGEDAARAAGCHSATFAVGAQDADREHLYFSVALPIGGPEASQSLAWENEFELIRSLWRRRLDEATSATGAALPCFSAAWKEALEAGVSGEAGAMLLVAQLQVAIDLYTPTPRPMLKGSASAGKGASTVAGSTWCWLQRRHATLFHVGLTGWCILAGAVVTPLLVLLISTMIRYAPMYTPAPPR